MKKNASATEVIADSAKEVGAYVKDHKLETAGVCALFAAVSAGVAYYYIKKKDA